MQLLNPGALLLLGLIPVLILIHSLKPKPKKVVVSDLFLWQQASREKRGGARIRRLMSNLPLYLQILAVMLASLALAKPVWFSPPKVKGNAVLVLDTSASMKTRTGDGIRFDQARTEAFKLIDELPKGAKMMIIEAGNKPLIKTPFTEDKNHLKQTVEGVQPQDVHSQMEKAMTLALSFMDPESNDQILFVTDGSGFDFQKVARIHKKVRTILVRGGTKNVGITRFNFRQVIDSPERFEIMLEIKNFNPHPALCPIHLTLEQNTLVKETIGLKAGEKKLIIFPYSGPISGRAQATLELRDDFPVDNEAFAVLSTSRDMWILLVSEGNYFLEKLLEAYPNFLINSVKEIIPTSWKDQTNRHDIVILDRISPPSTEKGNYLLIESLSPSIPISKTGQIESPEVVDWYRKNPLLANLDLMGLSIERANQVEADETLRPIIESYGTGLMYSYEENGLRAVYLGFDLTRSDLPLRVAFPVMMSNIFEWLQPRKLLFTSSQIIAGMPSSLYLGPQTEEFSVVGPSGKWEKYRAETNPFDYMSTGKVGIYTVAEGEKWRYFAVNLLNESESDIRIPDYDPNIPGTPQQTSQDPIKEEIPLWIFFLGVASVALILEWYFWLKSR
jgi:hypothetical protein